jgi:hypothetical protein
MKKREKKLRISKETLYELETGRDLKAVLGGADAPGDELSCTMAPSTAGGSVRVCC